MSLPESNEPTLAFGKEIGRSIGPRGALVDTLYYGIPPLIFLYLMGAVFHWSVGWGIGFLLALLTSFTIMMWGMLTAAIRQAKDAAAWFSGDLAGRMTLEELSWEELLKYAPPHLVEEARSTTKYQLLNTRLGRRRAGLDPQFVPLRVFLVKTDLLAAIRSYGTCMSTSYIFLTAHPSRFNNIERFHFLHELAHTTYSGCVEFARRYVRSGSLIFEAAVMANMWIVQPSYALAVAAALLVFRAWTTWKLSPIYMEMHADRHALGALADTAVAEEVVNTFGAVWSEDRFQTIVDFGAAALREHDFRRWNMQAALSTLKRLQPGQIMMTPPGSENLFVQLCTYATLVWAAWHTTSPYAPWLGIGIMIGVVWLFWASLSTQYETLFSVERELNAAITKYQARSASDGGLPLQMVTELAA